MKKKEDYRERCADCVCLVEDADGDWFCDEAEEKCADVRKCPEGN